MTPERPLPYIGISGVSEFSHNTTPENTSTQYWLMDQFIWAGPENDNIPNRRQLLLGVKAVHKTQYLDIENRYGREWYPVGEQEFATALDDGGINALKVAQIYFDPNSVSDAAYRDEFTQRICRRGKAWLNTLQFDMLPWQQNDAMLPFIEEVKRRTGHTIILQAHGESMQQLGAKNIAKRLGQYAHVLDYVLFDASHGKGVRMNPYALLPFLDACYESGQLDTVGFGVAGGLNAEVVQDELPILLEAYGDLSWDAEGRLHGTHKDGSFGFDSNAAKRYLQASADILNTLPKRTV
ncbi:MAG TPA: hypothetical protein PLY16_00180 [Candidatus Saccharibacteria bacterium]|nr:hypothetical protein [Candidatus Saccharibacteria bacterium]